MIEAVCPWVAARPPMIDGLSGDRRFLMAWARVWRSKERDEYLRQWVITMPYSPAKFRVNGIAAHVGAFYVGFGVKPGDALFREPNRRVRIWQPGGRGALPSRPARLRRPIDPELIT